MQLHEIVWPVFQIRAHRKIETRDNVTYIITDSADYIVDNKNLEGDNLGARRRALAKYLKSHDTEYRLYKLTKALYTIGELYANKHQVKQYIDYSGRIFKHTKRVRVSLIYRKVTDFKVVGPSTTLIKCQGIIRPIVLPYIPYKVPKCLGLLEHKDDYLVYELVDTCKADSWRKI